MGLTLALLASAGLPYVAWKKIDMLPIEPFGLIVAIGVLIGAEVCRRYSLRFGIDDDDHRKLMTWVMITGFIGAHVINVLAYDRAKLSTDPLILLKLWEGISSYGGFVGGALGFAFFVWWKRLTPGLFADVTIVGLLLAFSIGRIACTLVHDHIGGPTDLWFGVDYPVSAIPTDLRPELTLPAAGTVRLHNLGMIELAYLIPVNVLVMWLAFRRGGRRLPAGFIAVLTGILYAPVRFFLEYWRLNASDPRYFGLTFAQWCSLLAFAIAAAVAYQLWKRGVPAPTREELGGKPGGKRVVAELTRQSKS